MDGFNNIVKELQNNKQYIITALNAKGVVSSIDDTFMELANKITQIKEKEIITLPAETTNDFANTFFNTMMKSQGYDEMYETVLANYCGENGYVGALMTSLHKGTNTSIVLTGADAYYIYEEDKFYTVDENKKLVTVINGISTNLGTQSHLWDVENPNIIRTVFYLYKEGSTADGSRENVHTSSFDYCRDSNIPNIQYKSMSGNFMHFHVSNPDTCNLKWNGGTTANTRCYYFYTNVENANAQWMLYINNNALTFVNFEGLKKLTSGTLLGVSRVKNLDFPNLTEVTDGTLITQCNALESVDFPNLTDVTGGTLISKCNALDSVDFSNLESITDGILIGDCNALESVDLSRLSKLSITGNRNRYILYNNQALNTIILNDRVEISSLYKSSIKTLHVKGGKEIISLSNTYPDFQAEEIIFEDLEKGRIWCGVHADWENIYLKRIQLKSKGNRNDTLEILHNTVSTGNFILNDIEIAEGTRQTLTFTYHELDKENIINHIFKKLGNNNFEDDGVTPAPAIKITIGSNNLNKLTDEEKAIATDKNYILA